MTIHQNTKKIIALAPMDGITGAAMRYILADRRDRYMSDSNYQLYLWTEFMSSEGYIRNPRRLIHHIAKISQDLPNNTHPYQICQIYGGNIDSLVQTAVDVDSRYDYDGIELNIGCPSPSIMHCDAGSAMLKNRTKTMEIIQAISSNISKPFSIKTRIGLHSDDLKAQKDFVLQAACYCDIITIHGRTYKQSHAGEVDRDYIYDIAREVQSITNIYGSICKIIGNGGLKTWQDGIDHIGNLNGVMRGQSAMVDPYIIIGGQHPDIQQLFVDIYRHMDIYAAVWIYIRYMDKRDSDNNFMQPTISDINQIISHIYSHSLDQIIASSVDEYDSLLSGDRHSMIDFRKHLFRYLSGLPSAIVAKKQISQTKNFYEIKKILEEYQKNLG